MLKKYQGVPASTEGYQGAEPKSTEEYPLVQKKSSGNPVPQESLPYEANDYLPSSTTCRPATVSPNFNWLIDFVYKLSLHTLSIPYIEAFSLKDTRCVQVAHGTLRNHSGIVSIGYYPTYDPYGNRSIVANDR